MILREVSARRRFHVYAICDLDDGRCQIEEFMQLHYAEQQVAISALNALMTRITPSDGPPFCNEQLAKRLPESVCEFKAREKKAKQVPRVFFFEDGHLIICTNAFMKPTSRWDDEFKKCRDLRDEYFLTKARRQSFSVRKGWGVPHVD